MKKLVAYLMLSTLPLFLFVAQVQAQTSTEKLSKVVLVRGTEMTVCPYSFPEEAIKRVGDPDAYYSPQDMFSFLTPKWEKGQPDLSSCKKLLYGQLEYVPFGKQPTYVPQDYIYAFESEYIREKNVILATNPQFQDEKVIYKKVTSFFAVNQLTGQDEELPNTRFWFRGTDVGGTIGDVSEGLLEYKGMYYSYNGGQRFLNRVVLWSNPDQGQTATTSASVNPFTKSKVIVQTIPRITAITWYQNSQVLSGPIPWIDAQYGQTMSGTILPSDIYAFSIPDGRHVGYRVTLPASGVTGSGLIVRFKACTDTTCNTSRGNEGMYMVNEKGEPLFNGTRFPLSMIDLNTTYMREHRTVYVIVGAGSPVPAEGVPYTFYFGPSN